MLSRCFLDFSVGVWAFVIGLSQISSFFSYYLILLILNKEIVLIPKSSPLNIFVVTQTDRVKLVCNRCVIEVISF